MAPCTVFYMGKCGFLNMASSTLPCHLVIDGGKPQWSKYWRMKYRFAGKEKMLSIGVCDD